MIYYKILKDSELYKKLSNLVDRILDYRDAANTYITNSGYEKYSRPAFGKYAGGIRGIVMDEKPEGWKIQDAKSNLYYPKVSNKEALEEIESLPTIEHKEVNEILKYTPQTVVSAWKEKRWQHTPEILHYTKKGKEKGFDDIVIVYYPKEKYEILDGMEELTGSEFSKLYGDVEVGG